MATEKKSKGEPTTQLNAEVPTSLKKALKKQATEMDTTLSKLVTDVLSGYMANANTSTSGATPDPTGATAG